MPTLKDHGVVQYLGQGFAPARRIPEGGRKRAPTAGRVHPVIVVHGHDPIQQSLSHGLVQSVGDIAERVVWLAKSHEIDTNPMVL